MDPPPEHVDYAFGIDVGCVNFAYCILGSDGSIPRWGKRFICSGKAPYQDMFDKLGEWVDYIKDATPYEMHRAPEIEVQKSKRMIAIESYLYASFDDPNLIAPKKWRHQLGLSQGEYALNKASSLIVMGPILEDYSMDVSDDDLAESFLIAYRRLREMGYFTNGHDPWGLGERLPKTSKPIGPRVKRCRFQENIETLSSTTIPYAAERAALLRRSKAAKTPGTATSTTRPARRKTAPLSRAT